VDPKRDIEIINTELSIRDLGVVAGAVTRVEKLAKSGDKKAVAALAAYRPVQEALNRGESARKVIPALPEEARGLVLALNLLTSKPVLYVANVGEKEAAGGGAPRLRAVEEIARAEGSVVVPICGSIEAQISALESEEERAEYLAAVGLKEPGLDRLIRAGYELLGLITFFTVGPKEDRAWTVARGSTAPQAAGKIHSDMERGFIRAEVIEYTGFIACGGELQAKEQGKLRVEGKEYVIQDGDIVHFRFSV
jgi:hypothetical protein